MNKITASLSNRKATVFIAILLTIAMITTACGSSDTSDAPANRVLTIGVLAPTEGGLVDFGRGIRNAVALAIREANDAGTLPGWTIEMRVIDDSSDPAKGKSGAETLVGDNTVVGVIGPYNSGVALAALPVFAQANMALISPSNTLTDLTLGANPAMPARPFPNYFRMVGSDAMQGEFLAAQAVALGFDTAAVVSETKAVSQGLADIFASAFAAKSGRISTQAVVPDDASDFSTFLATVTDTPNSLIFFGGEYPVAARLRSQASNAQITAPIMGGDGMKDDAFITDAGDAATGTFASSVGVPVDTLTSADSFLAAYAAAGFTEAATEYGAYAYDAAWAVITALETALTDVTEPMAVRAALIAALADVKFDGATGTVAFDAFGDPVAPTFTLYRVDASAWIAQPQR